MSNGSSMQRNSNTKARHSSGSVADRRLRRTISGIVRSSAEITINFFAIPATNGGTGRTLMTLRPSTGRMRTSLAGVNGYQMLYGLAGCQFVTGMVPALFCASTKRPGSLRKKRARHREAGDQQPRRESPSRQPIDEHGQQDRAHDHERPLLGGQGQPEQDRCKDSPAPSSPRASRRCRGPLQDLLRMAKAKRLHDDRVCNQQHCREHAYVRRLPGASHHARNDNSQHGGCQQASDGPPAIAIEHRTRRRGSQRVRRAPSPATRMGPSRRRS